MKLEGRSLRETGHALLRFHIETAELFEHIDAFKALEYVSLFCGADCLSVAWVS
jgi:hypothetical protein